MGLTDDADNVRHVKLVKHIGCRSEVLYFEEGYCLMVFDLTIPRVWLRGVMVTGSAFYVQIPSSRFSGRHKVFESRGRSLSHIGHKTSISRRFVCVSVSSKTRALLGVSRFTPLAERHFTPPGTSPPVLLPSFLSLTCTFLHLTSSPFTVRRAHS